MNLSFSFATIAAINLYLTAMLVLLRAYAVRTWRGDTNPNMVPMLMTLVKLLPITRRKLVQGARMVLQSQYYHIMLCVTMTSLVVDAIIKIILSFTRDVQSRSS